VRFFVSAARTRLIFHQLISTKKASSCSTGPRGLS
jgi:hypothetical protein